METRADRNQLLLIASGLAAIAVVAWVVWQSAWQPALAVFAFAVVFLLAAFREELGLPAWAGPALVAGLGALNVVVLVLYPGQVTLILAVVFAATAPYHLSPRQSWLLLAGANSLFWIILASRQALAGALPGLLSLVALQAFAVTSSIAHRREELAREALAARNAELQAAREALARQTQAEERLRIAGALHDTIGHRLTALQLQLEVLSHEAPADFREPLQTCKGVAAELLDDVRALVRRMPGADAKDLHAVLAELEANTPGLTVTIASGLPHTDAPLTQQLAYCFQEAIHNAVRHGGADRIEVSHSGSRYCVDDNGSGLADSAPAAGFGLSNSRQRLQAFGGDVTLQRSPSLGGCRLLIHVPGGERA